jgi:hypothetical protein
MQVRSLPPEGAGLLGREELHLATDHLTFHEARALGQRLLNAAAKN